MRTVIHLFIMKEIIELYFAFFRIGAVNFGGGYAMLPLLERDLVQNRGWTTTDDLTDYFAIGQCTPGLIALNVATFIGSRRKGITGAIAATLGFISVPILIILLIATFLQGFADLPVVQNAFAGIRVCVCVLIIQAVMRLWGKSVVDRVSLTMYLVVFLMTALSGVLPLAIPAAVLVILSGMAGVLLGRAAPPAEDKNADDLCGKNSNAKTEGAVPPAKDNNAGGQPAAGSAAARPADAGSPDSTSGKGGTLK